MKQPLLYALHSGNLYGTERMALATCASLADQFDPVIFAPPGPALLEAARLGFGTHEFNHPLEFAMKLRPYLSRNRKLAFIATGVTHSLACLTWNKLYRRDIVHLHVVHGGTDEALSYGRKNQLNGKDVTFIAVSGYVKERLVANGVLANQVTVIENFLTHRQIHRMPKRPPFAVHGVQNVIVISRVDPIKRLDLLLDALHCDRSLARLNVTIYGTGWELDTLRARATQENLNVTFAGFHSDMGEKLAQSDLLVHTCPEEPFGLAIIEAMAARVPVLVPDRGGAGALVEEGVTGFRFKANQADYLAARLIELQVAPAALLNQVAAGGAHALATRFSATARTNDYRRLLHRQTCATQPLPTKQLFGESV